MRNGQIPWSGGSKIKCCKDCTAPKRHVGCHDTCEEYKTEKAEHETAKQKERKEKERMGRPVGKHDFDMLACMHKARKR